MTVRIPMSVLGGFLGAGKTTLLNRVLSGRHGVRYAVLVNDFGAVAVDGSLVAAHDGETLTFANGCMCCVMGDDLVGTLDRLLDGTGPRSTSSWKPAAWRTRARSPTSRPCIPDSHATWSWCWPTWRRCVRGTRTIGFRTP